MGGPRVGWAAGAAVLLCVGTAPLHGAEPPAGPGVDAQRAAEARELYLAGLEAQQRQDWQAAYRAFSAAYARSQHYQIAGNLGSVEMELGHHCAAAEHLTRALRDASGADEAARAEVHALQQLLAEATSHVASLRIRPHLAGAALTEVRVWVDDEPHPWRPAIFVEPGAHRIQVRAAGASSSRREVRVTAGSTHDVPVGVHLAPTPKTMRFSPPRSDDSGARGATAAAVPARPIWPAVLSGSAALASAAFGVAAAAVAAGTDSDADARADEIAEATGLEAPVACSAPTGAALASCEDWRSARSQSASWWGGAAASFAVAGGAAAVTLLYLLWPEGSTASEDHGLEAKVGPASLSVGGRF